ncbi:MAG: site-2 protease family protein [Anaerolineae bacterium]|nr:site-2 protease family protein [Anaerolineae bacterium]
MTASNAEPTLLLAQENTTAHLQYDLQHEVRDVFEVHSAATSGSKTPAFEFHGRLLVAPDVALTTLEERFRPFGYTPFLHRKNETDLLSAIPGIAEAGRQRVWINVVLAIATLFTTMLAGAQLAGANVLRHPVSILEGLPFALTLMVILGSHELGHYFMGRWHKVRVTLPYFIPVPAFLGTFGAFIQMRSPIRNRAQLFDVGFAGPIVGFVVALPLLIIGLLLPPVGSPYLRVGDSLLTGFLSELLRPEFVGRGYGLNPVALAAYFGILLTGVNLLPAGQLDGGHIAYAIFGRAARPLGFAVIVGLLVMGTLFWRGWYLWAGLIFLTGLRHPSPLDEITPVDTARRIIGIGAFVLLLLTFIPVPN